MKKIFWIAGLVGLTAAVVSVIVRKIAAHRRGLLSDASDLLNTDRHLPRGRNHIARMRAREAVNV
jgi:hypothetical protein